MPRSAGAPIRSKALIAAALLGALPGAAAAQSHQCRLPERVTVPKVVPDGKPRRMPVTGYTLALSWSPEYCRMREGQRADARQCSGRAGSFGLIVHGLWPEGSRGWPQWCPAARGPGAAELRPNLCMTPSARLLAREWAKHGACMTRRPATYFRVTRILYNGLRFPDLDRLSREEALTAGTIRARLAEANRGWRAESIGVHLNRRGWLKEIQLCYDGAFMPKACDRRRFGARDAVAARIWRGL